MQGRALLKNRKDRVLLLLTNVIAAQEQSTQGGASALAGHSAKAVRALPTQQQQEEWRCVRGIDGIQMW